MIKKIWEWIKNEFRKIKKELTDKITVIIFIIVFLILSSEVWLLYLLGFLISKPALIGIASACWVFWLSPATPFFPLCFFLTFLIRKIVGKITGK